MILGIFGAGGLGREYLETAWRVNEKENKYEEIIFVVDNPSEPTVQGIPVLDFAEAIERYAGNIEMIVAVGEPASRRKMSERVEAAGVPLATLIHPSVEVPESTTIGRGTYIGQYAFISCNVTIGNYALIQPGASIGHDCVIGDNAVMSALAALGGHTIVGHDSYLAIHVSTIENIIIGANSIVGIASVVHRDIPDGVIAMGNPARPMKRNDEEHRIFK